mmetsp:Transcript_36554/g.51686  ORF Transcript_36554/g.51686 Transcript_36554/m.51686 type:complete len:215 (+) Transcript_36554:318-962(+)
MQSKLGCLPLLERLENQWNSTHVRTVETLQDFGGLGVVLGRRTSNKCESGKVDHSVHNWSTGGIVEVFFYRTRKVKSPRVDGNNARPTTLQLRNQRYIVCVIFCVNVRFLKNKSDSWGSLWVNSSVWAKLFVVPLEIFFVVFENNGWCYRVPDCLVWEQHRFLCYNLFFSFHGCFHWCSVVLTDHHKKGLEVLRRSSKPVLERHHEGTGVSSLV